MRAELLYQRWLEVPAPDAVPPATPAMWAWPVPLSDHRTLLTLLFRPLAQPGQPRTLRTQILELAPNGDAQIWPPGIGYPAPVIFYANAHDDLFGLDLVKRGKIYVCRPDGQHCWDLETTIRMDTMIAPTNLFQIAHTVYWTAADGQRMSVNIADNRPATPRPAAPDAAPQTPPVEIHFPLTHLTRDGSLFIIDFEALPRVTKYRLA